MGWLACVVQHGWEAKILCLAAKIALKHPQKPTSFCIKRALGLIFKAISLLDFTYLPKASQAEKISLPSICENNLIGGIGKTTKWHKLRSTRTWWSMP